MINASASVKFPAFQRIFFEEPEKLFADITYQDMVSFIENRQDWKFDGYLTNFSGWLPGVIDDYGWNVTTYKGFSKEEPIIRFIPQVLNAVLFPYTLDVTSSDGIKYVPYKHLYGREAMGVHYCYPYSLVVNAMNNTGLPLAKALLLEAFAGVAPEDDELSEPFLCLDGGIGSLDINFIDTSVPYHVLEESLLVLAGEGMSLTQSFSRLNLIKFARQVYESGVDF